jgi:hypothetical protein
VQPAEQSERAPPLAVAVEDPSGDRIVGEAPAQLGVQR